MGQVLHWQNKFFSETISAFGVCLLSWEKVCYSTTGAKFSGQIYHLGFTGCHTESVARAAASHGWWHPGNSSVPERRQRVPSPQTLLAPLYYSAVKSYFSSESKSLPEPEDKVSLLLRIHLPSPMKQAINVSQAKTFGPWSPFPAVTHNFLLEKNTVNPHCINQCYSQKKNNFVLIPSGNYILPWSMRFYYV